MLANSATSPVATLCVAVRVGAQRARRRWRRCRCPPCCEHSALRRWRRFGRRSCWSAAPGSRWRYCRRRVVFARSARRVPMATLRLPLVRLGITVRPRPTLLLPVKLPLNRVCTGGGVEVGVVVDAADGGAAGREPRPAPIAIAATVESANIRNRPRALGWQGLRLSLAVIDLSRVKWLGRGQKRRLGCSSGCRGTASVQAPAYARGTEAPKRSPPGALGRLEELRELTAETERLSERHREMAGRTGRGAIWKELRPARPSGGSERRRWRGPAYTSLVHRAGG